MPEALLGRTEQRQLGWSRKDSKVDEMYSSKYDHRSLAKIRINSKCRSLSENQ